VCLCGERNKKASWENENTFRPLFSNEQDRSFVFSAFFLGCQHTFPTRISFGTNIDTDAAQARGRVHNVQSIFLVIFDGKGRDTEIAIFLNASQKLSSRSNGSLLVATTFATPHAETKGAFHRQEFGSGVVLRDSHNEPGISMKSKTHTPCEQ